MNFRSIARTLRLVRHLLPGQAMAQLGHLMSGRVEPVQLPGEAPRLRVARAARPFLPAPSHARGDARRLELINREVEFGERVDWEFVGEGLLWSYHLHQFDWLRQPQLSPALRTSQLLDWVARHPRGAGWRPHPISLRILSWGKLLLTPGALELDDPSDPSDPGHPSDPGRADGRGDSPGGSEASAGERIRLKGIDAPEREQECFTKNDEPYKCGLVAAKVLSKLIVGKKLTCKGNSRDRYGRLIAKCSLGNVDINEQMVLGGQALAYRKFGTDYVRAEKAARALNEGLWQGKFVPPWDWREGNR